MKKFLLSFFIFFFILISNTKALQVDYWGNNIENTLDYVFVYNWATYPSSYESLDLQEIELQFGNDTDNPIYGIRSSDVRIATQGISLTFNAGQKLEPDYLYSVTLYTCTNNFNLTQIDGYNSTSGRTAVRSLTTSATYQDTSRSTFTKTHF